jgi:hypothetical protein
VLHLQESATELSSVLKKKRLLLSFLTTTKQLLTAFMQSLITAVHLALSNTATKDSSHTLRMVRLSAQLTQCYSVNLQTM